jgi:nucleoside phosphorylase
MSRRQFDVGILVPLREEFRYVVEVAPQLESLSHEATYFYRLDFGSISAVCCLIDQMGLLPALHATNRLLEFADVKLIVLLGLGGALNDDVSVGDVVIASEVSEFQANSKAEPAGDGYQVRYSGRNWSLEFRIREAISHFEFSSDDAFSSWQATTSENYAKLDVPGKASICSSPSSMHFGPIASGSVVVASSAFASEVRRINRKFVAIDMEAAGVALAAAERIHPLPCLVVRGISDNANEKKHTLDEQGRGSWRRYCVRNATSLLRSLLAWEGFQNAAGLRISASLPGDEFPVGKLVARLKSCIGGPWIVGAAFGIYAYGPRVVDGRNVVPMDLNRLRVADPKVSDLLDAAEEQRETLLAGGQLEVAADGFARLIENFRNRISSPDADLLLQNFDGVVIETLCPEDDEDEQVQSLLMESDRLDEDVGVEAVIDLLRTHANVGASPALRERFIDALASAERWGEIVQLFGRFHHTELSRRELEHGVFACAKSGQFECAKEMMRQHHNKYDDNAGRLFRREIGKQYQQVVEARPQRET